MGFIPINILKSKYGGLINCEDDLEWALTNDKTERIIINTDCIVYVSEPIMCVEYYHPNNKLGKYFCIYTKHDEKFICRETEYEGIVKFLTNYC